MVLSDVAFDSKDECNRHICDCWSISPSLDRCNEIKKLTSTSDRSCAIKTRHWLEASVLAYTCPPQAATTTLATTTAKPTTTTTVAGEWIKPESLLDAIKCDPRMVAVVFPSCK